MIEMSGFVQLLSSGANAILTLEGQNTTCADVFYAWVCIGYHLEHVLASPTVGINHLRGEVITIYNHRFNQMMTETSYNLFLLAYYLHPSEFLYFIFLPPSQLTFLVFRHHGGLQLTMPALIDGQPPPVAQLPALFKLLLTSALSIFQGEQQRLQKGGAEMVPFFINEFIAYAYNKDPFRAHAWTRETKVLKWWSSISQDSNARLIAVSPSHSNIC